MYITILANGSRGDVQPFVALGLGLQQAGHQVRLATGTEFRDMVRERGLDFAPLAGDARGMLQSEEGRRLLRAGGNPVVLFRQLSRLAEPLVVRAARDAYEAVRDADVILTGTSLFFAGEMLAEATGLPLVYGSLGPMAPTREAGSMLFPALPPALGGLARLGYNQLSHEAMLRVFTLLMRAGINRARQEVFGLPPRGRSIPWHTFRDGPLFLNGYSHHVSPRPRDWSRTQAVTGYWFLDRGTAWEPSARLVDFIASGPAPVSVGFGSMNDDDPAALAGIAVDALRRIGRRGILLTGWGGLRGQRLGDDILILDQAPHDWLFPRVSAVVHHGGAGTTAAALRAGKPSVIVPYMADQPYWGRRVSALGAGPAPIPRRRLTVDSLAEAMHHAVTAVEIRAAAERTGARIRAEDGVMRAVEVFQRWANVSVRLRGSERRRSRLVARWGSPV